MMAEDRFIQNANLLSYSGTNCLRNDSFYHACQECVDICPENAFRIIRNKLTLFEKECIGCAACIGSCPSEALQIKSFDPNTFVAAFKTQEKRRISCKENTPCLGVFDQHHFITMALEGELRCDLSHCEGCPLNREGKLEAMIRSNIAKSERFFEQSGIEASIDVMEKREEENERRALFRVAIETLKEGIRDEESLGVLSKAQQRTRQSNEPLKFIQLKKAIRNHISRFKVTKFNTPSDLFFEKRISFEACTNCGDCIGFCPTDALAATSDNQGILFTSGHCIGCGICDDICKSDAISTKEGYDLVTIAYERTEQLVHYDMVMCHECRCPYPYRGGEPICERCKNFKDNFESMFTLAKDL